MKGGIHANAALFLCLPPLFHGIRLMPPGYCACYLQLLIHANAALFDMSTTFVPRHLLDAARLRMLTTGHSLFMRISPFPCPRLLTFHNPVDRAIYKYLLLLTKLINN